MGTVPRIEFLIPVHNAADTLDQSLASVARQDLADFGVIIVDDGSTDRSPALLDAWVARDRRFKVVRQDNGGIVSALNRGLALVQAPFVARMDADDLCFPVRLSRQLAHLESHPGCTAVGARVEHIDAAGAPLHHLPQPEDPGHGDPRWIPAREPYIIHPFAMFRTAALKAIGGYRHVPNSEDSDLYWRLSELGEIHNLKDVLGQYRIHQNSVSAGTVINARVTAIGSRLGALSAARRRAGQPDLDFAPGLKGQLQAAVHLEAMMSVVSGLVGATAEAEFRLGVGIKLLELAGYRPFRLEREDCEFIAAALAVPRLALAAGNRAEIDWYLVRAANHLLAEGRWREARRILPSRLWPRALAKLARGRLIGRG